jgi:UDP-N-acetylmuramoylalanine--D-glutamate ligase
MDLLNCSFTILGIGRSGIAAARLLKRNGVNPGNIFLSDSQERDSLKYFNEDNSFEKEFELETGIHSERILQSDVIIKSPGIPPHSEIIKRAIEKKKKIYSEIEIAYRFCRGSIIGITGTNGKTTTTVLTGEIFKEAGFKTYVCGNVGLAFSEIADKAEADSVIVLELSSYQLLDIEKFKPRVSILLNITEDHIEWHGSFENYLEAKIRIFENQDENDLIIFNYDDKILNEKISMINKNKSCFSIEKNLTDTEFNITAFKKNESIIFSEKNKNLIEEILKVRELNIRGNHNLYNSLSAIIAARAFGIKKELIRNTLKSFTGVEHRIEFVKEIGGVKIYNDSKATNLDSLIVALESFDEKIILIMGGLDSGNDYSNVENLIQRKVRSIIAIGDSKEIIRDHFKNKIDVSIATTLNEAVNTAMKISTNGEIILFSPACKSFDMYDNFEQRGNDFKKIVNSIEKK